METRSTDAAGHWHLPKLACPACWPAYAGLLMSIYFRLSRQFAGQTSWVAKRELSGISIA